MTLHYPSWHYLITLFMTDYDISWLSVIFRYDMLGLPEKVEEFDYGLKMETEAATDSKNLTAPMDVVRKRYENWFHVKSVKIS